MINLTLAVGAIISIDRSRCIDVASAIRSVSVAYRKTLIGIAASLEYKLRLLLYFMSICYDTRRVWGYVDGRYYRGSDYLYYAMLNKLIEGESFEADRIEKLTVEEFTGWFSSGNITRIDERLDLIKDTARMLKVFYDGYVSNLLEASSYRLSGSNGFAERLSKFKAFSDPLAKKIMVLASLIEFEGLASFTDSDRCMSVGVDYHLQRVALRVGMVRIIDPHVFESIAMGRFVSRIVHDAIRSSCMEAYRIIIDETGFKTREVDAIFWNLGRSCCTVKNPSCHHPCSRSDICSFTSSTTYLCMGSCILNNVCEAARNRIFMMLKEPRYRTYYY
jgi:hypothetical protein